MAVQTRPYLTKYKGIERMVEASSPAAAIRHVVGPDIEELRPARGAEVNAWHRAKKPVEIAGEKPEPSLEAGKIEVSFDREGFDHHDAAFWLSQQPGYDVDRDGEQLFGRIIAEQRMTLEVFDALRVNIEGFEGVIATNADGSEVPIDTIRAGLEGMPMPLERVVFLIGEQKRRELYVAPGEERMVGDTGHLDA